MLKILVILIIVLFYISLFVELFFYNIPSVVATKKILNPKLADSDYFSEHTKKLLNWPLPKKILMFVLPMAFIYVLHGFPLFFLYDIILNDAILTNVHLIIYAGILLVIIGRVISHFYLINIKKIKAKSFEGFIISGLFKFSRNPGLLGLYISFLGFLIIRPSISFLICFLIYITHMHFKIKMEEGYLINKHGEDYKLYLQKTRRYL